MSDEMDEEVEEAPEDEFADGDDGIEDPEIEDPDIDEVIAVEDFSDDEAVLDGDDADDDDDDDDDEPAPKARKVEEDDDDDDDDEDPDDVEADLEAILRDRMAAEEDDDDDDAEEAGGAPKAEGPSGARNDEFVCDSCFLLVNRSQFGSSKDPRCPMGDTECPSIVKIFGSS